MAKLTAEELMGSSSTSAGQGTSLPSDNYQPFVPGGQKKDAVGSAIEQTKVALTPSQHTNRLQQLLNEQKSGGQKPKSTAAFLPGELARTTGEFALGLASPFMKTGATVEEGLMRPLVGGKPTERPEKIPEFARPYENIGGALLGTGEIGLSLLPETTEVKALLKSANLALKERKLLGLGAPKAGTKLGIKEAETISGQVLRPSEKQIASGSAKRATEGIELLGDKEIGTYREGEQAAKEMIGKLSEAQDKRFAGNPMPFTPSALEAKDSGFIKAALKDMAEVYSKTRSPEDTVRITETLNKFDESGLTAKEINDVAREYNTTFKNKAFKADGTPATSWAGEGYENTRTAVKQAARNLMPDEITAEIDDAVSKLYSTEEHFKNLANEIEVLKNKTVPTNIIKQIMGKIGGTIGAVGRATGVSDMLAKLLPKLISVDETISPLELEKNLGKNLARIRNLKNLNKKDLAGELIKMAEEVSAKESAALKEMKALPPPSEQPIIVPARGQTMPEAKTGQVVAAAAKDISGPIEAEVLSTEEKVAQTKAINQMLGKTGLAGQFPIEATSLIKSGKGNFWIMREGTMPTRISPFEAYVLEKAGYKFTNKP